MKWSKKVTESVLSVARRRQWHARQPSSLRHLGTGSDGRHQYRSSSGALTRTSPVWDKVPFVHDKPSSLNITKGTVRQILPVGTTVQQGDVVALVQPDMISSGNDKEDATQQHNHDDDDDDDDISIIAPQTGRITEWYVKPSESISLGDSLLELDHDVFAKDEQAWKDELTNGSGTVSDAFLQQYKQLDDVDRLQYAIAYLRNQQDIASLSDLPFEQLYQRVVELQAKDKVAQAQTRTDWGVWLFNQGNLQGALQQLQQSLQLRQDLYEEQSHQYAPILAASHIHLGAVYKQSGQLESALQHMERAVELQIQDFGSNQHARIASGYNNMGAIYFQLGQYADAKIKYQTALDIHQGLGQSLSPEVAGTHHNLGVALKHLQDYDNAGEHLQIALETRLQLLQRIEVTKDNDHAKAAATADVAASRYALGQWCSELAKFDDALQHFQSALELQEALYGKDSPITAAGYNNLGGVYYQQEQFQKALSEYQKALQMLQNSTNSQHPDVAATLNNVGLAFYQLGEFEQALDYHQQARSLLEGLYGKDHPILATTIGSIGNVYKSLQQFEQAMTEYQTAHQLLEQAFGPNHPEVGSSFNNMGLLHSQQGQVNKALEAYQAAAQAFSASLGAQHPHTGSCHFNVGLVCKSKGDMDQAKQAFQQALNIWQTSLGAEHPNTAMAAQNVSECQSL